MSEIFLNSENAEMQKVFVIFKSFAKQPEIELVGRNLWHLYANAEQYNIQTDKFLNKIFNAAFMNIEALHSRCQMTVEALLFAIFGVSLNKLNYLRLSNDSLNLDCSYLSSPYSYLS